MAAMKLNVNNATFSYDRITPVLKNISFDADSGDLIAILGPNGAGKTTLLRCMMGLLHWTEGNSSVDGVNIKQISNRELWQKISYVPQSRNVARAYTVKETVLLGRSSHLGVFSQPAKADIDIADSVIKKLHIEKISDKKCTEISGGELQMVLIARALAAEPEVLVLDEPESNLDFRNQLIVLDTMSSLVATGMTCIFNTHYPTHALQRANKSLILTKGGDYIFGDTQKMVTEENIEKAFGVKAVIGDIETPGNILRNVVPLSVSDNTGGAFLEKTSNEERVVASMTIISKNFDSGEKINEILHSYSNYVIGRMGMPYQQCGIYIINVNFDAPSYIVEEISSKFNMIHDLSIKTTFAKGGMNFDNKQGVD
jgi:iron complex transport system ATP-binding protein